MIKRKNIKEEFKNISEDFKKVENGIIKRFLTKKNNLVVDLKECFYVSLTYNVPLHPEYVFYWNELNTIDLIRFLEWLLKNVKLIFEKEQLQQIILPKVLENKRQLEIIGVEHKIINSDYVSIEHDTAKAFLINLGVNPYNIDSQNHMPFLEMRLKEIIKYASDVKSSIEVLNKNCLIELRDKGGTYIGARMGRPEKAKMRKQFADEVNSFGLFPVGKDGGMSKNIVEFFKDKKNISENFKIYFCSSCKKERIYPVCEVCNEKTVESFFKSKYSQDEIQYKKINLNIENIEKELRRVMGNSYVYPKAVKGITSTINKNHTTEHISKAFLREKNGVYVNKDGTIRYDMIEMGITHFKPKEIGTSIEKLKDLGYTHDYLGKELKSNNQLLEIFPQDVILPDCIITQDELASSFVMSTGNFIDELLEKLYKLPKFYSFKSRDDTIGHLVVGLAPHTSAGIIGRIIGYSKTQGGFAHPVWHAAQRRNLDGDESGIILLLDALVNFSRDYLPDRIGTRTMDVPLVLTTHLHLDQIDDEVHGMDIEESYPLEFYRIVKEFKSPKNVKILQVKDKIDAKDIDERYFGARFTHSVDDFNATVLCSSYKTLPSMDEKIALQLDLADKIRAVDKDKVAELIIEMHLLKDIRGNLKKFTKQTFRCTKCNAKYRRVPLCGKCTSCLSSSLNFTIYEGSIRKYMQPCLDIIGKYDVSPYLKETVRLVNIRIEGLFGKEEE